MGQTGFLALVRQPVSEKENSRLKPVKLHLKNWPLVTSCPWGGLVNISIKILKNRKKGKKISNDFNKIKAVNCHYIRSFISTWHDLYKSKISVSLYCKIVLSLKYQAYGFKELKRRFKSYHYIVSVQATSGSEYNFYWLIVYIYAAYFKPIKYFRGLGKIV